MVDYIGSDTNRITGPNEFGTGVRGLAWSTEFNSWFVSAGDLFKLSLNGMTNIKLSTPEFIIPTNGGFATNTDLKAVAFIKVGGVTKLFGTSRLVEDYVDGNTNGWIIEIDPVTGANVGFSNQIAVHYPPGGAFYGDTDYEFGGLLGLAQDPQSGVVYGIRFTGEAYERELVTIDMATGNSTVVGILTDGPYGQAITSLAFVPDIVITSTTRSGGTLTITWTGAAAPTFSLQTTASLTPPISWTTVASGLTGPSTTTSITNSLGFFRISKP